ITVNQERFDFSSGKRSSQINGCGGLTYPTFLVSNGDYASHEDVSEKSNSTVAKLLEMRNTLILCNRCKSGTESAMFHVELSPVLSIARFHKRAAFPFVPRGTIVSYLDSPGSNSHFAPPAMASAKLLKPLW